MTIQRIQFEQPIDTRDGTLNKDSRTCNGIYERDGTVVSLEKRPGLIFKAQITPVTPPAIANSQCLTYYSGNLIAVISNTIYKIDPNTLAVSAAGGLSATANKVYTTRMTRDTQLVLHNTINGYSYTLGGGLTTLPLPGVGPYVPGIVYLDDYIFVGDSSSNLIYSSNLSNPSLWSSLASIGFVQTTDTLVGICKHLNYLVAFGKTSVQFYYDSGNGSSTVNPLAVAQSYTLEIGCAHGDTVASADNTVLWVGYSRTNGKSVYMMDGVTPNKVSTSAIDKVLESANWNLPTSSYIFKYNGHSLYVLTLHSTNITIVYDMTAQAWYQWTQYALASSDQSNPNTYVESYFRPTFYTQLNNINWMLDDDTATLYALDANTYQDNGQPIYFRVITELDDSGTTKRKFFGRLEIIGDKIVGGTMQIRHTGNDYNTFSNFRTVDLSSGRSQIYLGGSDRRRAWEFLSTSNVPLRLDCAEIDFRVGEMDQEQNMSPR